MLDSFARTILDHMVTAVIFVDQHLEIRYLNPAAEILLDLSWRRVEGMALTQLIPQSSISAEAINRALEYGQSFTQRDSDLTLTDGRVIAAELDVSPTGSEGGDLGILIEIRRLDQHRRMNQENHLISQSKTAREMVRSLAHEIKNPLGGLRGAAQLLEHELPASLKEYTQIIIGEADRLTKVVDRMLGPNSRPNNRIINIHMVLERVKQLVLMEFADAVVIERDYDPSIPELWADPELLIQAILNVVRNACQILSTESKQGVVLLRSRTLRQAIIGGRRYRLALRIDVVDNGPGIAPDLRDSIFYPMVTGRDGGSGLGLSIAQALINQHRGIIDCESEPGHTQFSFHLPITQKQE